MELYQTVQNRVSQTVAVINENLPGLKAGTDTAATLLTRSTGLGTLAQTRDNALVALDGAVNTENHAYLHLRLLTLALPQIAEGELNDEVADERALLDLLDPVYAIVPRTPELAQERGKKLRSALTKLNAYLAAQTPPRPPIEANSEGIEDLIALLEAQPGLGQFVQDHIANVTTTRTALHGETRAVDRLSKRFYKKLQAEARTNPALAIALAQIDTENDNLPGTLGIRTILQGGTDGLHLLVSYEGGTGEGATERFLEWSVVGVDPGDFTHSVAADPSGNALGPFAAGQTVKLRTRVSNANGTRTGGPRTLTLLEPMV